MRYLLAYSSFAIYSGIAQFPCNSMAFLFTFLFIIFYNKFRALSAVQLTYNDTYCVFSFL